MSDEPHSYDALVIGAGCVGAGTVRDLAMRGLKVAVVDMRGPGAGTTHASSGFIHGGARYLLSDVATTRRSCEDAGHILRIARFLCFRVPMLHVHYPGDAHAPIMLDAFFSAYDRFAGLREGKPHARLSGDDARRLEPALSREVDTGFCFDEWGIDAARLCILNVEDAKAHGAHAYFGHRVLGFLTDGRRVRGVRTRCRETGALKELHAKLVVNACGPWTPLLLEKLGIGSVKLRWGKGSHLILERRVSDVAVITHAIDGRAVFLYPHEQNSLIGTTDDDYYGDPDEVLATRDEALYLVQAVARAVPGVRASRVVGTLSGLRPTLFAWGVAEDDLSRGHIVVDHAAPPRTREAEPDAMEGLVTVAGGKLATYRMMAEEASDVVCRKLGRDAACRTHLEPLPGAEADADPAALARRFGIAPHAAARLCYRHGCRAERVLERLADDPALARTVCPREPVLAAEVAHVVEHEGVRTLDALRRHTRLGFGVLDGATLSRATALLARLLDQPPDAALDAMADFLALRRRERAPVLAGAELAQEAMMRNHMRPLMAARRRWRRGWTRTWW